jgi:ATP-dependent Lon protease
MSFQEKTITLPLLPIRNDVLFPRSLMPLVAGRSTSLASVEAAMAREDKEIIVVAQREAAAEEPRQEDLFGVGTKAVIRKVERHRSGTIELVIEGIERVAIIKVEKSGQITQARVRLLPPPQDGGTEVEALHRAIVELASKTFLLTQAEPEPAMAEWLYSPEDPLRLVYFLGSVLTLPVQRGQSLLEASTHLEALRLMYKYLSHEVQVLELRNKIASEAGSEISREQRDYLLRQQLRAIQQELGEQSPEQADVSLMRSRLAETDLPEEPRKEAERELGRIEKLPSASPEYHVIRSYLDLILELPWRKRTEDMIDIPLSRKVLDEDHYDLKEVKERIVEQLAVLKLNPRAKAPILCFVGPPGTGKTSLGQSIARAMGRKFERTSLGGLHDEAELRGHRRTYIGAMPGRIIQAIRRAAVNNPLLMLDEVDKLGRDYHGDPAAALLEILDPEQNRTFRDNYLDVPFDLSKVLFITTANTFDTIPRPLLDRVEVLYLSGYSEEEKIQIARRYLIPRQLQEAGLALEQLLIPEEALRRIIQRYTREAGLRQLERAIGGLARKAALHFADGATEPVTVTTANLAEMLGPERFFVEEGRKQLVPGVAAGLAWTETGGDVLYVEAALLPDGRGLTLTGHLGDVMQESAKAAHTYIWAHCHDLGIDQTRFRKSGVHVHVPAGATPKDGPSAGVTMVAALASLYTQHPARGDTAMTGEITLTGLVLPVGGVKEKVLAARRAGLVRVILPKQNEKDLCDIPDDVRGEMQFVFVDQINDVLAAAIPELAQPCTIASAA